MADDLVNIVIAAGTFPSFYNEDNNDAKEALKALTDFTIITGPDESEQVGFHKILLMKYSSILSTLITINPGISSMPCEQSTKESLEALYLIITGHTNINVRISDIVKIYNFCHKYNF